MYRTSGWEYFLLILFLNLQPYKVFILYQHFRESGYQTCIISSIQNLEVVLKFKKWRELNNPPVHFQSIWKTSKMKYIKTIKKCPSLIRCTFQTVNKMMYFIEQIFSHGTVIKN